MVTFWQYLGNVIIQPRSTFIKLDADFVGLKQGIRAVLLIGALYTLTVVGFAIASADISSPPWITIPAKEYYFWEIFFALPVMFLAWILSSGLIQLLSRVFHGHGSFEQTLAATGFAFCIPFFITWVTETVGIGLVLAGILTQREWFAVTSHPGFWQTFATLYQLAAVAWMLILLLLAISTVQKIRGWQTAILGFVSLGVFMTTMLIFIR